MRLNLGLDRFVFLIPFVFVAFVCGSLFAEVPADPTADFLSQVLSVIQGFGGMAWQMKITSIVLLLMASMKVSLLKPLWQRLGGAQAWLAPLLGLVVGVVSMNPFSWAGLVAYVSAGVGAIAAHELLDGLKKIPKLGPVYVRVIEITERLLGGKPKPAPIIPPKV
jgi:hypothetical protein